MRREDGKAWDFSIKEMRDEATQMMLDRQPFMLISSPPYTMYSILQNGNRVRFCKTEWDDTLAAEQVHIASSLKLFENQRRMVIYFLFEHPKSATSWKFQRDSELHEQARRA